MASRKTALLVKTITALSFAAMILVNILANLLPINGVTTGEAADRYPTLFTPAPYTFTIWTLIYLLLLCFTVYFVFHKGENSQTAALLYKVGMYFSISSVANLLWVIAFHYGMVGLSVLLMAVLLTCLILIVKELCNASLTPTQSLLVALPFHVYLGWITVATIANVAAMLVGLGWNGFGLSSEFWTVVMLIAGGVIGIITARRIGSIAYLLVLIWAYLGILVKHLSPSFFARQYPWVIWAAALCIAAFIAAAGMLWRAKHKAISNGENTSYRQ